MPSPDLVRKFENGRFYHIYNRGVEKRQIFLDTQDYGVFLNRLKWSLIPDRGEDRDTLARRLKNHTNQAELISYCLMPNHFHLLVRQLEDDGIRKLMQTISTSYSMYFNNKYKRVGSLFQGRYKSRMIDTDQYLQHITRYIHLNPSALGEDYNTYPFSSFKYYMGEPPVWLNPEPILKLFGSIDKYRKFIDDMNIDSAQILKKLTIDDDAA